MANLKWAWLVPFGILAVVLPAAMIVLLPETWMLALGGLAGLFLIAGLGKLRDRAPFTRALASLGIRGSLARALAVGLPITELIVASGLLITTSAAAAAAALVLLFVLTAGAGAALARGQRADCGCFGARSARLSELTLLRNGMLVGVAGGTFAVGLKHHVVSGDRFVALVVAALVTVAFLAWRNHWRGVALQTLPQKPVGFASTSGEVTVTRRHVIRAMTGAGLTTLLGARLATLKVSPALAAAPPPPTAVKVDCEACYCCQGAIRLGVFVCLNWCCTGCKGFSGGGVVKTATGTAQASFFGNNVQLKGDPHLVMGGALTWFDAGWRGSGLLLQSTQITSYGLVPGTTTRQLAGIAHANGKGKYKFVLHAVDAGKPGSGLDKVTLTVSGIPGGGAGGKGHQYVADGHVVHGDVTTNLIASVSVKK